MKLAAFSVVLVGSFLLGLCDEFVVDADSGLRFVPKSCLHLCKQGSCLFQGCSYTRCPGGACHFIDCKYPSCSGKFIFLVSIRSTYHSYSVSSLFRKAGLACLSDVRELLVMVEGDL